MHQYQNNFTIDEENHPDMISPTSYIRKNYPDEHEEITRQKRSNALTKLEELNKVNIISPFIQTQFKS